MPMTTCANCNDSFFETGHGVDFCQPCRKRKVVGSHEELTEHIRRLREAVLMAIGFHAGMSLLSKERLQEHLVKAIKDTE